MNEWGQCELVQQGSVICLGTGKLIENGIVLLNVLHWNGNGQRKLVPEGRLRTDSREEFAMEFLCYDDHEITLAFPSECNPRRHHDALPDQAAETRELMRLLENQRKQLAE